MRLTSSPRVTSARTAACPSSAASFSTPGPSRSARSSFAPSAASLRAEAAPIPLAAPVIRTVRPFKFPIGLLLCAYDLPPHPALSPNGGDGFNQGMPLFGIPLPSGERDQQTMGSILLYPSPLSGRGIRRRTQSTFQHPSLLSGRGFSRIMRGLLSNIPLPWGERDG